MNARKGYVLIALLLFFTVLGMSSTVAVLEQDTRLKRFSEEDLRLRLDSIRRAVDLYQYTLDAEGYHAHCDRLPTASCGQLLKNAFESASVDLITDVLIQHKFLRASTMSQNKANEIASMTWRLVENLVKNPSFEIDDNTDYGLIGTWQGNYTANDGVPNGWNLITLGAEQYVIIESSGRYIVSFWAVIVSETGYVKMAVYEETVNKTGDIIANDKKWKRHFKKFDVENDNTLLRIQLEASGTAYVDGVMLEKWKPPTATAIEAPSAWTKDYTISSDIASRAIQERLFTDVVPANATAEDYSFWLNW